MLDGLEVMTFADDTQWESWLADHHDTREGVWLRIAKKGAASRSVNIAEALEVALCFGWIDSHRRALDESHYLQKYSPRRPKSSWSKVNTDRVKGLIAAGRMRQAGMVQVLGAQADGRWDAAYESQRTATIPLDLEAELSASTTARRTFELLGRSDRYALILRLLKARTPNERAAQLRKILVTLEAEERAP
jgi:uncharacterized protein YdeI (YjbR/CyaY-like superfamily)